MSGQFIIDHPIVLIGLMGAGKSTVGHRLAKVLGLTFIDSDNEIEKAAGCSIEDIFDIYGEPEFRAVEKRVLKRLMKNGPMVLATGGGAFMNAEIRATILNRTTAVWLNAGLDALVERTSRKNTRPLLKTGDPRKTLKKLMDERYCVYEKAHITIDTDAETLDGAVIKIIEALKNRNEITS